MSDIKRLNDWAVMDTWSDLIGPHVLADWAVFGELLFGNAIRHEHSDGTIEVHVPGQYEWTDSDNDLTVLALVLPDANDEPIVFVLLTDLHDSECVLAKGVVDFDGRIRESAMSNR